MSAARYVSLGGIDIKWGAQSDDTSPQLPMWAYDVEVANKCHELMMRGKHTILQMQNLIVGHVIPLAFLNVCTVWFFFIIYPWLARLFMHECTSTGLASYPDWLVIPFWLVICFVVAIEYRIMKVVIVPQLYLRRKSVTILGVSIGHTVWRLLFLAQSLIGHADLVTNSSFVAKVEKTVQCHADKAVAQGWTVESLWKYGYHESLLRDVPLVGLSYHWLVVISWMLMLVQLAFALGMSLPLHLAKQDGSRAQGAFSYNTFQVVEDVTEEGRITSVILFRNPAHPDGGSDIYGYRVPLARFQTHEGALQALADAGRMTTVTSLQVGYMQGCVEMGGDGLYVDELHTELKRVVFKFLAYRMFEAVIQPNVQATTLGLASGVAFLNTGKTNTDAQTVVSIIWSLVAAFLSMMLDASVVFDLYCMVQQVGAYKLRAEEKLAEEFAEVKEDSWYIQSHQCCPPVFAAADSWDIIAYHTPGTKVQLTHGPLEIVDGFAMAPIHPTGHIDMQYYRPVEESNITKLMKLSNLFRKKK